MGRPSDNANNSERILDPKSHHPSPLSALPEYKTLHDLVHQLENTLPDMTLLRLVTDIRDKAWTGLREILYKYVIPTSPLTPEICSKLAPH